MQDNIRNALLELIDERGLLMPEHVVETARSKTSPLHQYFTWDDNDAAYKWRIQQARVLIGSVKITLDPRIPISINAFVSLPTDRVMGGGYRTIETVLDNAFMQAQLLEDIHKNIEQWESRAAALGMIIDLAPLKKIISKKRSAIKRAPKEETCLTT